MAIEFLCEHCSLPLRAGDDKAGRRATCPGCGAAIQTPDPRRAAGERPPAKVARYPCPMCGELIAKTAPHCPFCGEDLRSGDVRTKKPAALRTSNKATASLTLGIVGLVTVVVCCISFPCNILAIVLGAIAMGETKDGRRPGRGSATAGLVLGILGLLITLAWCALIFWPRPAR